MGQQVHPMVPVPEAIRIVIQEAARILLEEEEKKDHTPKILSAFAPWSELLNQVLDKDVLMSEPGYPPYNASIMDGYAIRTNDDFPTTATTKGDGEGDGEGSSSSASWTHQVVDKVYAGDDVPPKQNQQDENLSSVLPPAYYITTGAVVPDTFNCVVPIEECKVSEDKTKIQIQSPGTSSTIIADQQWIRPIGCDIPTGSVVLPKGHVMDPIAIGLLKQSGVDSIQVKRKIVVGILSTGNELILGPKNDDHNNDTTTTTTTRNYQQPGKIPDVNRPILLSMISSYGTAEVVDLGNERDDDVQAMATTIDKALETCDVIITTGGISMGETDIVEHVLVEKCGGTLHFGRMNMKPGKPTTYVTIPKNGKTRIVFAMPGNPVSAIVCTQLLVKPCLDLLFNGISDEIIANSQDDGDATTTTTTTTTTKLQKIVDNALLHPEIEATLAHDVTLDAQRPEYHRVTIHQIQQQQTTSLNDGGCSYSVSTTGVQRSSRLMSCRDAQGLLVLPKAEPNKPKALAGERYPVLVVGDFRGVDRVQLKNSIHLRPSLPQQKNNNNKGKDLKVAVIEVLPRGKEDLSALEKVCEDVQKALSGSKSGTAIIVSKQTFFDAPENLYAEAIESNNGADVIVVSCVTFEGSFQYHLSVSSALQSRLTKQADALALQVRQGSASQTPATALFETVVGYAPEHQGAMLVCLSDRGLTGGLGNVRGLLKHALNVARGKPHNHHHTHAHHDHSKAN